MVTKLMRRAVYSVCLAAPAQAHAQQLADVAPATRLRLLLPDSLKQAPLIRRKQFVTGRFIRATADSVYLQMSGSAPFGVAVAGVPMWVSRGASRSHSALQAGAAFGLFSAAITYTDGRQGRYHQTSDAMVAGAGVMDVYAQDAPSLAGTRRVSASEADQWLAWPDVAREESGR